MNLPNKLTLLRIVLIVPFLAVLYLELPGASYIALAIFIAASLTDMLDGGQDAGDGGDALVCGAWADAGVGGADCHRSGVRRQRPADGGQRPGARHRRRLVRKGQDGGYHGVYCGDAPAPAGMAGRIAGWVGAALEYRLYRGYRCDDNLLRGGVLLSEQGLPAGYVKRKSAPCLSGERFDLLENRLSGAGSGQNHSL